MTDALKNAVRRLALALFHPGIALSPHGPGGEIAPGQRSG